MQSKYYNVKSYSFRNSLDLRQPFSVDEWSYENKYFKYLHRITNVKRCYFILMLFYLNSKQLRVI